MKRIVIVMIATLLLLCVGVLSSCTTTATWQDQYSDTNSPLNVASDAANPSAKYIVYAALKTVNGEYVLKTSADSEVTTTAYAVVGYTGLVAELVIPEKYDNKDVVSVLACSSVEVAGVSKYGDYELYMDGAAYTGQYAPLVNNPVVTSITFGTKVVKVGAGVCAGMVNLTKVTFTASTAVKLGHAAFSACNSLTTVVGTWSPETGATPFLASGYTPQ